MSHTQPDCPRCAGEGWITVTVLTRCHGARTTEASCPVCCAPPPDYVLAWKAAYKWRPIPHPCRHCTGWTHLRDRDDKPAHWLCAAQADDDRKKKELAR
jgi:hypothetical protein